MQFVQLLFQAGDRDLPIWKILAARAASARPSVNTSAMCCAVPARPKRSPGSTAFVIAERRFRTGSRFFVPSWSIDVNKISPAPRRCASAAHENSSLSDSRCPPCVSRATGRRSVWRRSPRRRTGCRFRRDIADQSGLLTAALLTVTLSARGQQPSGVFDRRDGRRRP